MRRFSLSAFSLSSLLVMAIYATGAHADSLDEPAHIKVTGDASLERDTEVVDIRATFSETAKTAREANEALRSQFTPVLDHLEDTLPEAVRVEAGTVAVRPNYRHVSGERRVTGYTATRRLSLKAVAVADAGQWLDAVTDANPERAGLVNERTDDDSDRHPALSAAVTDARDKAEAMVEPLDVRVGSPLQIEEVASQRPRPMAARGIQEDAKAPQTEVRPGQVHSTARVRVRFELLPE